MLVLTRKENEEIIITTPEGRQIRISVIAIKRSQTRIGIDCDRSIIVDRKEIHDTRSQQ